MPVLSPSPLLFPTVAPPALSHHRAPVRLDDGDVLRVGGAGDLTAEERASLLADRLEAVLTRAVGAPAVTVIMMGYNPVLEAEGVHIVTVTDADAAREGEPLAVTAVMWRTQLERGLRRAWRERSGENFGRAFRRSVVVLLLGLGMHLLAGSLSRRYLRDPGWLMQGFVWLCVVTACLSMFPNTRGMGQFVHDRVLGPLVSILAVLGLGILVWVVSKRFLDTYFNALVDIRSAPENTDLRGIQRLDTVRRALQVLVNVVLVALTLSLVLVVLHINPATLLASAGVLGVAIGVAAQDQLKDWTAGLAIIFEDQFGVGDVIAAGAQSGTVVAFTLRATQIRNTEGSLITIPNSALRIVENQSNNWSQVDLRITIDYATPDPGQALALMEQAARELRESQPDMVLEDPEMLGVDAVTETAVVLRMLLKTAPQKQFAVRRLLLDRIKTLLDQQGIRPPATRVWIREAPSTTAMLPSQAAEPSAN